VPNNEYEHRLILDSGNQKTLTATAQCLSSSKHCLGNCLSMPAGNLEAAQVLAFANWAKFRKNWLFCLDMAAEGRNLMTVGSSSGPHGSGFS